MALLNGQGLLNNAIYGLTNTYNVFAQNSENGKVSIKDLTNPSSKVLQQLGGNTSFAQYIAQNAKAMDKDGDGNIDGDDVNDLASKLSQKGLSYQEIVQLCNSGAAGSNSLTSTVLAHFNQIDQNNDGRINDQEIKAFSIKADEEKMTTKYKSFKSSDMSVFYNEEGASSEKPSSLIDTFYPQDES